VKQLPLFLGLLIPTLGFPQNHTIDRYKIAGGSYALAGGFWSPDALQTAKASLLKISGSGNQALGNQRTINSWSRGGLFFRVANS
jgi:hypothetical protein